MLEPEHGQNKNAARDQVEASGSASQQVEAERCRSPKKCPQVAAAQPLVLEGKSSQREQHDVTIFLHVLGIVQVGRAKQQSQHTGDSLVHAEAQLLQQAERDQRRKHSDKNIGAVADDYGAHGRVVFVTGKHMPVRDPGADQVRGQHDQRLADPKPAEDAAASAMQPELRVLIRKNLRLRGPQPVRGLQPVHGVGGAQFARLHYEGEQARDQAQKKTRIAQLSPRACSHSFAW